MTEVKKCIRALAFIYLLLAISSFLGLGINTDKFPTDGLSSIYFLTVSFCLVIVNYQRVAGRSKLKKTIHRFSIMIFLLFFFRGIKYTVLGNYFVLSRYTWYLYYWPVLCIPELMFFIALYANAKDEKQVAKKWCWVSVVTLLLVALVLTNDLHFQVFKFNPGFADWNSDYSYGWGFWVVTVWQYLLYLVAVIILVAKHPIDRIKRWSWMFFVPFTIGAIMLILIMTDKMPTMFGWKIINFHEALCCMAVGVVECAMQLGMIPVNKDHDSIFKVSNVPVQITDAMGRLYYKSATASDINSEYQIVPDGTRIAEHTVLHRLNLPKGYGFWEADVTEIDTLNEELKEANERLSEENELIRLQNELKEKQKAIEQKTKIYDNIAKRTQRQSGIIADIAEKAANTTDKEMRDKYRKQIVMLGAYIKRYANLMILNAQNETVSIGEFSLAVSEALRYINLYGISGEIVNNASGKIYTQQALEVFEAFEVLLENCLSTINGVYANLSMQNDALVFKVILENLVTDSSEYLYEKFKDTPVQITIELEDDIGYYGFLFTKGGDE